MIANTVLTEVAGLRRSVRTTSHQEPIKRTTPRYKTMMPMNVPSWLPFEDPLPNPKNQALGSLDVNGEPLWETPISTHSDPRVPVVPAAVSGIWRSV
jgi:hypothetical protein